MSFPPFSRVVAGESRHLQGYQYYTTGWSAPRILFAFAFKITHISGQTFEVFKTSKVFKMST
jgi:hypothetical protein